MEVQLISETNLKTFIEKNYDVKVISVKKLRDGGSSTYLVYCQDNKYLLKFIAESFRNTVVESLDVLKYLQEKNFPSPKVILTKEGLPFIEENQSISALYKYFEGVEIDDDENYKELGAIVGKLHKVMENYSATLMKNRKEFFIDRYISILKEKEYNRSKILEFKKYGDYLWDKIKDLPKGFCHGDLHRGNVIKTNEGDYHLLDFDTSCNAFSIYDIMLICNSTDYFTYNDDLFELTKLRYEEFLKGYQKYIKLDKRQINAFYDFVGIYHYQLQATIIEIYGLDCVDDTFLDNQLDWLMKWKKQCEMKAVNFFL